jgi:hypothetical protein
MSDNVLTLLNSVQLPLVPGGIVLAVIRQEQNRELLRYWVSRGRR